MFGLHQRPSASLKKKYHYQGIEPMTSRFEHSASVGKKFNTSITIQMVLMVMDC